jgi:site-specific DNA-adenine methylase
MRTPLSYYGGKQQLASRILGMIPEHHVYCEPFCGGAAIFFSKEPSGVEIINDTNGEIINFYEVLAETKFPCGITRPWSGKSKSVCTAGSSIVRHG